MTLLLWISLGMCLNAQAGWEYNETARPMKKRGLYPKPAAPAEPTRPADSRVQVFGKPAPEMSAEDYAEMLKEDQAPSGETETPAAEAAASAPSETEREFEALRARMRTRQVAETAGETESDYEPAAEAPKKTAPARGSAKIAKPAARSARPPSATYIPPPPMDTEVITPQKAAGKKVKSSAQESPAMEPETSRGDEVNAAFPYTHLLPSPFNLPQGTAVFGTTIAYGIFDFFQVSTNVARDIQKQWNFGAKVPLVEYPTFVASAFVDYQTFNPHSYDPTNVDLSVKRWQPGLVTGYEITPDIAFFLGGNFSFGEEAPKIVTTSGYLHGAQLNMEWSWLYNPSGSRLGNNAIALGLKYDLTYSLFGLGFTHHWRNFELGVHYTFADRSRFLPIAGFSVSSRF